jgi:GxxExxY protein
MLTKKYLKELTYDVIGAAIEVQKTIGPGLLESVYQKCMEEELILRKIHFESELTVPIHYKDKSIDTEFRCDLFVEKCLVLELKSVESIQPLHKAQIMTYMKLLNSPKGILINFNSLNLFSEGQLTFVNEMFRNLPDE